MKTNSQTALVCAGCIAFGFGIGGLLSRSTRVAVNVSDDATLRRMLDDQTELRLDLRALRARTEAMMRTVGRIHPEAANIMFDEAMRMHVGKYTDAGTPQ